MSEVVYKRATQLLEAELGEELVALYPQEGSCFGFNEVAALVWRQLKQPQSFNELRQTLLAKYTVDTKQCTKELHELMGDLVEKGLVVCQPCKADVSARESKN